MRVPAGGKDEFLTVYSYSGPLEKGAMAGEAFRVCAQLLVGMSLLVLLRG